MLAKITSGATVGLNATLIDVEVDIQDGLPAFTIVGLPDKAVEESKERVRSAIKNSGADFPTTRITVNLAPADLPKMGPAYDLPIALGILIAGGQISPKVTGLLFLANYLWMEVFGIPMGSCRWFILQRKKISVPFLYRK